MKIFINYRHNNNPQKKLDPTKALWFNIHPSYWNPTTRYKRKFDDINSTQRSNKRFENRLNVNWTAVTLLLSTRVPLHFQFGPSAPLRLVNPLMAHNARPVGKNAIQRWAGGWI